MKQVQEDWNEWYSSYNVKTLRRLIDNNFSRLETKFTLFFIQQHNTIYISILLNGHLTNASRCVDFSLRTQTLMYDLWETSGWEDVTLTAVVNRCYVRLTHSMIPHVQFCHTSGKAVDCSGRWHWWKSIRFFHQVYAWTYDNIHCLQERFSIFSYIHLQL